MLRLSHAICFSGLLAAFAGYGCAGDAQTDAQAADAGDQSDAQSEGHPDSQVQLAGSYTLTFQSVTVTKVTTPSTTARLDLQDDAGTLKAVLTVEWSPPSPCAVTRSDTQLQLECTADVSLSPYPNGEKYRRDRWTTVIIPLNEQGGLGSAFSATGVFVDCGDDYCPSEAPTTGHGTVAMDTLAPQAAVHIEEPVLPWSTFYVSFSEPVDPQAAMAHLQVSRGGAALPVVWKPEFVGTVGQPKAHLPSNDENSTVWAGRMVFKGRLSSWDGGPGSTISVATAQGVADPAGNQVAPLSESKQVMDLKAPASSFDFDTAIPVGTWGPAEIDNASCESGGCLRLGPSDPCSQPIGLAGLLPDTARTKVRIRYRAGTDEQGCGDVIYFLVGTPALGFTQVELPELTYVSVDNGLSGLSDWTTAEVALPSAVQSGSAGFEFGFTSLCILPYGEPKRTLWVESIVFE